VVAEYAIALALRDKQRVIYTTPIKALSNQKFRDLQEDFVDVGLMTGDVTINPSASCLVMTTEILRSMLYKGSEIMREVQWVVFDEIHYMRDSERGVVWEETIVLLPDNVRYVFLSATIPNAKEFAEWICHLHKQPCNVVYTEYRPTPLQHYIFPCGGDGLHLIVNDKREFNDVEFDNAMAVLRNAGDMAKGDSRNRRHQRGGTQGPSNIKKLVKYAHENGFLPLIVFSFSKKDVESNALEIQRQGGLDFTTDQEKKLISEVFNNAMECLSEEDRALPQVTQVLPILKKGIGIHHGGLLPILKETIEILFSENLIKCLFATETFAMGVNMPAKTVVFTAHRKFDGKDFRPISGGEYIQMSGRAGRRGMDNKGIVILMVDDQITPAIAKQLLQGSADPLNSAFHLTYNMVLNLLRVEDINPEWLLEKSFYQFQHCARVPQMINSLDDLEAELKTIEVENEEQASSYYRLRQQIERLGRQMDQIILSPQHCLPFINPGRLVKVRHGKKSFGWGIIINFKKEKVTNPEEEPVYRVDIMVNCDKDSVKANSTELARPAKDDDGVMEVIGFSLKDCLSSLSCVRLMIPQKLTGSDEKRKCREQLREIQKRFPEGLPLMDPIEDMHIIDSKLNEIVRKIEAYEKRLFTHPLHGKPETEKLLVQVEKKQKVLHDIKDKKKELKKAKQVIQLDELKARKRVLRRLGYATAADVIETKGRVACEISTADELLLTEMIFNGVFNTMTVEQCTAVLSCLIFQEKGEMPKLAEELATPLRIMQESARRIAKVSIECKLELDEDEYVQSFNPNLMDVVSAWCKGGSFAAIVDLTDVYEGSIIRAMRRLEELLRDMCHAAKAIGNEELEAKFAKGIETIKRDIVFAASLYL